MARRASKGKSSSVIMIIGVLVLIILFAVAVTFFTRSSTPYSKLAYLPINVVTENGNSLRDNEYRVEGKIEERWVKENYEGIHLSVEQDGQQHPIFIKIPKSLERPNLERENSYAFSVKVGSGGIPVATGIERL